MSVDITTLCDAAAGRIALGDEDTGVLLHFTLDISEMYAAIAQLAVVQIGFLAALASQFCHTCHCLAFAFAVLHLLDDDGGDIGVLVQIVIDLFLHKVTNELIDGNASLGSRCQ